MPNLLIEVGTEELPLSALDVLYQDLGRTAESVLKNLRVGHGAIKVEATPRRIVLFVEGLENRQKDENSETRGPSFEKGFGADGNPTAALEGFVKSRGASLKDIEVKDTPKGKFIFLSKHEAGKPTAALIPQFFQDVFGSLTFPKQMRWELTGFRFPRPIRWLVVLLDKKTVNVSFAGMKSENLSYGHRFLSPGKFKIDQANWPRFSATLKKKHVVLEIQKREEIIRSALASKYRQKNPDEELVHLNAQLVEEPFLIQGKYSKEYFDLPSEVLASCMKKNQKIFACYDAKKSVDGRFVAVLNGKRNGLPKICRDFENVLESRLKDARFFYKEDTKSPLSKYVSKLNQIVYLGKLGNMQDKTSRLMKLAEKLCDAVGYSDLKQDLKRAAELSKADLVTQLVYEFADLQGIVGREYAKHSGEKKSVAEALGTQYLPKNLTEDILNVQKEISPLGAMLGVIDRLDLLTGAFRSGLEPTGSQDPYALRRAGGILVKLIRAYRFRFPLDEMIRFCSEQYETLRSNVAVQPDFLERLKNFFKDRTIFELKIKSGTREYEIFQAVCKSSFNDIADVFERYEILNAYSQKKPDVFLKTAKVVERTSNILKGIKGAAPSEIRSELLREQLEKELFQVLESSSKSIREAIHTRDYALATKIFGQSFYRPIHDFFEQIMVNAEDSAVRGNRQALMKKIHSLYADEVADLSVLSRIDVE